MEMQLGSTSVDLSFNPKCKLQGSFYASLDSNRAEFIRELHDIMIKYQVSRINMNLDPFSLLEEYQNSLSQ